VDTATLPVGRMISMLGGSLKKKGNNRQANSGTALAISCANNIPHKENCRTSDHDFDSVGLSLRDLHEMTDIAGGM